MTALPRPSGEKLLNVNGRKVVPGETVTEHYNHSQFAGAWKFRVTRVEKSGEVFGVYHLGDVYEMDAEDVM